MNKLKVLIEDCVDSDDALASATTFAIAGCSLPLGMFHIERSVERGFRQGVAWVKHDEVGTLQTQVTRLTEALKLVETRAYGITTGYMGSAQTVEEILEIAKAALTPEGKG